MPRRRALLRSLGAVAAGGVLAGCQGSEEGPDDDTTPGPAPDRTEFPTLSADEPTYREWIPARTELDASWISAINFAQLRERKGDLSARAYEQMTSRAARGDYFGVPFERIEGQIVVHRESLVVHLGEFDGATIRETLAATGYEQRERRGAVTFHLDPERERAFAVGEQGVIEGPVTRGDLLEQATTLFETAAGERTRRDEASEAFALFADDVGWPLRVTIPRPWADLDAGRRFEDVIPTTAWYDTHYGTAKHTADESLVTRHWLGAPGDEGSAELLRSAFKEADFTNVNEPQVAVRETISGAELAALAPFETTGDGSDPIQVTLTAEVADGTLILDHRGGDTIPAERLRIRWEGNEYTPNEPIESGETRRIEDQEFTGSVRVEYTRPNGDPLAQLAQVDA